MYCQNCGTVSSDIAVYCQKCGKEISGRSEKSVPSAVDIALAQRSAGRLAANQRSNAASKLIIGTLVVSAVVLIPVMLMFRQISTLPVGAGAEASSAPSSGPASPPGLGLSPETSGADIAIDAGRKANASRLQMAIEKYYAQNDIYPRSLDNIPAGDIGFALDPQVFRYQVSDSGYRLEVIMKSNNISGANIVNDGSVTKYVVERP